MDELRLSLCKESHLISDVDEACEKVINEANDHDQLINKLTKELNYMKSEHHKWEKRLGNMESDYSLIMKKQIELQESLAAHAVGLQNVYNKFQEITDGSLIEYNKMKLEKLRDELMSVKRNILIDIQFVKKCYKTLPAMSKIKELDEESYERFMKVVELIQ